jgi:hypothetical protein
LATSRKIKQTDQLAKENENLKKEVQRLRQGRGSEDAASLFDEIAEEEDDESMEPKENEAALQARLEQWQVFLKAQRAAPIVNEAAIAETNAAIDKIKTQLVEIKPPSELLAELERKQHQNSLCRDAQYNKTRRTGNDTQERGRRHRSSESQIGPARRGAH